MTLQEEIIETIEQQVQIRDAKGILTQDFEQGCKLCKDIELIVNIDKDTDNEESIIGVRNNEEHYKEVLKRFNKMKNEDN